MVLEILGGVSILVGLGLVIYSGRRININSKIKAENQALENANKQYVDINNSLLAQIAVNNDKLKQSLQEAQDSFLAYSQALEQNYQALENSFDTKKDSLSMQYLLEVEKQKRISQQALSNYSDSLDEAYEKIELSFDKQLQNLKLEYNEAKAELDKIQATRAAVIQAQLREKEINNKDNFYSLHLTEDQRESVIELERVKSRFPDKRVISMLIWQYFFQKQLKTLCANILGTSSIVTGIYKITNKKTKQCYVGQALDVAKRLSEHVKCGLGIDTPAQNKLYAAMEKEGLEAFTFELIEKCPKDQLNEKEKYYIELYQSCSFGYNSNEGVGKRRI